MPALRFLAAIFLLVAVLALVTDVTMWRQKKGPFQPLSIARQWQGLAPASMQAAKVSVVKSTHPAVWSYGVAPLLNAPIFALFGVVAIIVGYLGRRRYRVNVVVN